MVQKIRGNYGRFSYVGRWLTGTARRWGLAPLRTTVTPTPQRMDEALRDGTSGAPRVQDEKVDCGRVAQKVCPGQVRRRRAETGLTKPEPGREAANDGPDSSAFRRAPRAAVEASQPRRRRMSCVRPKR